MAKQREAWRNSPQVLGVATLRVTGRSGDAVGVYPRIATLEQIELLPEDGQKAIREAMRVVNEAQLKGNTVFAVSTPGAAPIRLAPGVFDPTAEQLLIAPRIMGG